MKFPLSALILLACTACASTPDSKYYALSAAPAAAQPATVSTQANDRPWTLSAVTIPEILNRPQMIVKSGANAITLLEYDRWAEPLDSGIRRILSDDLTARTANTPLMPGEMKKEITVTIDEFDADDAGHVYLAATWSVKSGDVTASYSYRHDEAGSRDISSTVAAMSSMLGKFADAIQPTLVTPVLTAPSALPPLPAATGSH